INLRAYAQSNPLNEYKREAFNLFKDLLVRVREETTMALAHFDLQTPSEDAFDSVLTEMDFSRLREETPNWLEAGEELAASPGTPFFKQTPPIPNMDYAPEPARRSFSQ